MSLDKPQSPRSNPSRYFLPPVRGNVKYLRPDQRLEITPGVSTPPVPVTADELECLESFVRWESAPPFPRAGRSAYVGRAKPLQLKNGQAIYRYKLKGVGNYDQEKNTITPPQATRFQHDLTSKVRDQMIDRRPVVMVHQAIADDGSFYPVVDPPKPVGGLNSGRGQSEFENALTLFQAGVPACIPVSWGIYSDQMWEGKNMEYVILGLPAASTQRVTAAFEPDVTSNEYRLNGIMKRFIQIQLGDIHRKKLGQAAIKVTEVLGLEMGKLLRKAHEAGVARFAGHLGNISWLQEGRSLYLHDLDSSVKLDSLHPNAKALTKVRDIESALFGLAHSFTHASLFWIAGGDPKLCLDNNPLEALIKGYFGNDANPDAIKRVSQDLMNMVLQLIINRTSNPTPMLQQMWMSEATSVLSPVLTHGVFQVYESSTLNEKERLPYTLQKLIANLQRYAFDAQRAYHHEEHRRLTGQK